jgi:hypothetical protein
MIPSLQTCIDYLAPAFTQPSFATNCQLLLGWVMCLGKHTLFRVAHSVEPHQPPDLSKRHGLDAYYNFFERSAWTPKVLARRLAVLVLTTLKFGGITLLVDDTLSHKRGKSVWGMGWFRDAVASTANRVVTASGHNWVVVAVALCVPGTGVVILAIPLMARLHLPGKGQPSCATLAREMLQEIVGWFPGRTFSLVGDGAYACKEMLANLPERVTFVGRLRGDAALYDPNVPLPPKGKRGPKAKKGPRLPSPKEAAAKADRPGPLQGGWLWLMVSVLAYGQFKKLQVLSYQAVWPHVLGLRRIKVVVVRDPEGTMRDCYLFTTDLQATMGWVILQFAWRWAIEVLFRSSKQVMDIEAPQHWCQSAVAKVGPWVWSMQSVIMLWYITAGQQSEQAAELRARMGEWDSEWSLRHMIQVLQRAVLDASIDPNSASAPQLLNMVQILKNWALLAA